jgi:hypothetical protein
MAMSLRVEDHLKGAQNYLTWKERMTLVMEVNDVLNHTSVMTVAPTDPQQSWSFGRRVRLKQRPLYWMGLRIM